MPSKTGASTARYYLIALSIALSLFLLDYFRVINFNEDYSIDLRLVLRGQEKADPSLLLVEIDDKSLLAIGSWPWKRSTHAALLEILKRYEPRLIVYDVFFGEPSTDEKEDKELSLAIEQLGNVVLPFYLDARDPDRMLLPVKELRESAVATGFSNITPDQDGHLRRVRAVYDGLENRYYHTSALSVLQGFVDEESARSWLRSVPLDEENQFLINFPGTLEAFESISFNEVINLHGTENEERLKKLLKNRIILIGLVSTGSAGMRPSAFSANFPRIAVNASAMHTLLSGKFLRVSPDFLNLLILLILAAAVARFSQKCIPRNALLLSAGLMGAYFIFNFAVFKLAGYLLPLFVPLVAIAAAHFSLLFFAFLEASFQRDLIQHQLGTAARIQEAFLPRINPNFTELDIAFHHRFAGHVGGDLYDWIDFGDGSYGVCIGDVSGKGVPAAIYMVRALSEFRRENRSRLLPSQVFSALNAVLVRDGTAGMFLTMVYLLADTKRRTLSIASAGHDPLILFQYLGNKAVVIDGPKGPPLGIFTDAAYETTEIPFDDKDLVLLLSDGITELRNAKGRHMGIDRVRNVAQSNARESSAQGMIDHLVTAMDNHARGSLPHDDQTLLCVKFGSKF